MKEENGYDPNQEEGNPAEDCRSAEIREISGENPEAATDTEEVVPTDLLKTEEEMQTERHERQDIADEQAEAVREAEEARQLELSRQGEEPVVIIKGVRKSFGDHEVLRGVDLHVNKGENLVILGKSGTGKSVLIKCLVGLEWPDEGEIRVFGKSLSSLSYGELNESRIRT